jgi:putative DNA primase/helicase
MTKNQNTNVVQYPVQVESDQQEQHVLRDIANAKRFAAKALGRLLFVSGSKKCLKFDAVTGWVTGTEEDLIVMAKSVVTDMWLDAGEFAQRVSQKPYFDEMLREIRRASTVSALSSMIYLARSESGMSINPADMDSDGYLLGVKNGVVNLRAGSLHALTPELIVTKRANASYDPEAKCERFIKFLLEIFPKDEERVAMLRILAYLLTGDVSEQKWFFLFGTGSNGKSVLMELMAYLLGDYATKIQTELLIEHRRSSQGPSNDLVSLQGKRMIYCNETTDSQKLDHARIKDLTGGDSITGRANYSDPITFSPTHKLIVIGNHMPSVSDDSEGFWRRLVLIPFNETFSAASLDPYLLTTLKGEASGILTFLIGVLCENINQPLPIPQSFVAQAREYRSEQDTFRQWLEDHTESSPAYAANKKELYLSYLAFLKSSGQCGLNANRFSRKLAGVGFRTEPDNRTVKGIRLCSFADLQEFSENQ